MMDASMGSNEMEGEKYQRPRLHLPQNFRSILKEYAREVLRAQPADLLEWSAEYFKQLALQMESGQLEQSPSGYYEPVRADPGVESVTQSLKQTLASMDMTHRGVVNVHQIRCALIDHFQLSPAKALYIMTSAVSPINPRSDIVEYEAFANSSAFLIQLFQQLNQDFVVDNSDEATVHGMSRDDVTREFRQVFRLLDEAGTGRLPWMQYCDAVSNNSLNLTERDVKMLCLECKRHCGENGDEVVYEDEVPYLFDRLALSEQFDLLDSEYKEYYVRPLKNE